MICGGIYARVYCILYYVYDVVVTKVHVRYLDLLMSFLFTSRTTLAQPGIYLHPLGGYTPPCDMSTHPLGRTPRGSQSSLNKRLREI